MRVSDILFEDVLQLRSDVDDLLVSLIAQGKAEVSTQSMMNQLSKLGHQVSDTGLVSFLDKNPLVNSADVNLINLNLSGGEKADD